MNSMELALVLLVGGFRQRYVPHTALNLLFSSLSSRLTNKMCALCRVLRKDRGGVSHPFLRGCEVGETTEGKGQCSAYSLRQTTWWLQSRVLRVLFQRHDAKCQVQPSKWYDDASSNPGGGSSTVQVKPDIRMRRSEMCHFHRALYIFHEPEDEGLFSESEIKKICVVQRRTVC